MSRQLGMCFFDTAISFDMIRGGHIAIVVLGDAYQVSERDDLANWGGPERLTAGTCGAMDMAIGIKKSR